MLRSQFTGFSDRQSPFTVNKTMQPQFTVNCLFTDHKQLKMSITNHKELKMPITCHENKYIYPTWVGNDMLHVCYVQCWRGATGPLWLIIIGSIGKLRFCPGVDIGTEPWVDWFIIVRSAACWLSGGRPVTTRPLRSGRESNKVRILHWATLSSCVWEERTYTCLYLARERRFC